MNRIKVFTEKVSSAEEFQKAGMFHNLALPQHGGTFKHTLHVGMPAMKFQY